MSEKARGSNLRFLLALAHFAWQAVLFVIPLVSLITTSFRRYTLGQADRHFSGTNYQVIVSSPFIGGLYDSIMFSLGVSICATALAAGAVIGAWLSDKSYLKSWILIACALVFFTGAIPRTYVFQFLLSSNGPLRQLWQVLFPNGGAPLHSPVGVFVASLALVLPLNMIIMYVFRRGIDPIYLDCARDLGAGELTIQARIVVPLLRPAFLAGLLLSFIFVLGDVVAVGLVGGSKLYTAPLQILDYIRIDDWGTGAAGAVILLGISLLAIMIGVTLLLLQERRRWS